MQRNIDEVLQHDGHLSEAEGTADQHDEPNACIESIDNDNATDPEICKMEKTNSLGKIFQRLKSGNKKYHLYNASNMGKLDDPVVAPDSIDGNAKFSELEKSNSLGKMFQKMRPSKKVQQKRPSSAVSGTSAKGFRHFVRGIWQKDSQVLSDEISVAEKFEEININENPSDNNTASVEVHNVEK